MSNRSTRRNILQTTATPRNRGRAPRRMISLTEAVALGLPRFVVGWLGRCHLRAVMVQTLPERLHD